MKIKFFVLFAIGALLLSGCQSNKIDDYIDSPITTPVETQEPQDTEEPVSEEVSSENFKPVSKEEFKTLVEYAFKEEIKKINQINDVQTNVFITYDELTKHGKALGLGTVDREQYLSELSKKFTEADYSVSTQNDGTMIVSWKKA